MGLSDRTLRITTIILFIIVLPICIVHGVISRSAVPVSGIAPMFASAALAIWILSREARSLPPPDAGLVFLLDAVLAISLFIELFFCWQGMGWGFSQILLGAHATFAFLLSFLIHLYFALRWFYYKSGLQHLLSHLLSPLHAGLPSHCPNCKQDLRPEFPALAWLTGLGGQAQGYFRVPVAEEHDGAAEHGERYRDEDVQAAEAGEAQPQLGPEGVVIL